MKKAIFLDLDGTLLNNNYQISSLDIKVIKAKKLEGFSIYIITGKSFNGAIHAYKALNLSTTLVAYSGQVFYYPSNNGFQKSIESICKNTAMKIIDRINQDIIVKNYMFASLDNKYYSKHNINSNLVALMSDNDQVLPLAKNNCKKIIGSYIEVMQIPEIKLLEITKKLNQEYKNQYDFAFWTTDGNLPIIQFKPKKVGKSIALKRICQEDKIDYTIAIGNGWSDRHMLLVANLGVAMKNASIKVKSYADAITTYDNNNSGVGHFLKKIKF